MVSTQNPLSYSVEKRRPQYASQVKMIIYVILLIQLLK